jgi:hypothetical protein
MTTPTDPLAATRQRLLAVSAALLEALYEPAAVPVLATLRPADMRPGGARVPGTSYELEVQTAARAMGALLAVRAVRADALVLALAQADQQARYATLAGQVPPTLASLYAHCTPDIAAGTAGSLDEALNALCAAAEKLFTPTQARRIAEICQRVREKPVLLDQMPVQQFIAGFVRNAP